MKKSKENCDSSTFFQSCSGPDFAKISAPAFHIFLVSLRAQETNIWPISSNFPFFLHEKCVFYSCYGFSLSGKLPGNPGPFKNERPRKSHSLRGPNTLIRQNLTHLNLNQTLIFRFFFMNKCVCYSCSGFSLSGKLPCNPGPFKNERSRNYH